MWGVVISNGELSAVSDAAPAKYTTYEDVSVNIVILKYLKWF